jgi:signal transduction histidine kinase
VTRRVEWQPAGLLALVVILLIFTLIGTVGWRRVLRRRSIHWLRGYFVLQLGLFITMFTLENIASGGGSTGGNLIILLMLQSSVMTWRFRLIHYVIAILTMGAISLLFLPAVPVIMTTGILFVTYGGILLIGDLIVREERAHQKLDEAHIKLTEYAAQVEELATTRERNRLAREIHDNVGHYLTIVNMQIEAALAVMETDSEQAKHSLHRAQQLTKEGLTEIRNSVAQLRTTPTSIRPLHEAIAKLVEEHSGSGLQVDYHLEGQIRPCSAQIELTLYRTVQEALTNVRKHAQAKNARILLDYRNPQAVQMSIEDDGIGAAPSKAGFGLVGIQERLRLLGGSFDVQSSKGQGFRLSVELPA